MTAGRIVLGKTRRVHFVGIAGIGMSGIAELLANLGYVVTGSDVRRSPITDRLERLGIGIRIGHDAALVGGTDVVVTSSAVRGTNPEVVEARRLGVPVIPRAEMLAELMRLRSAIAVAGAHGKTTTTSMIALVLERAGLDPTAVIGGRLSAFGSNARLGQGQWMVAEADESDRSFLQLFPTIAVITNIDHEHLESYGGFGELQQAFVDFANKVPFYGVVVACADDPPLAAVFPRMTRRLITYGLTSPAAEFVADDVETGPMSARARVRRRTSEQGDATELGVLTLHVPGRHNLQNALAAVAVGLELGLPFDAIASGLRDFRGAERRFEVRGERAGVLVVDDYGHHPTEIRAVLAAAQTLGRRIVVVFQPHRFSRTAALLAQFGAAFNGAARVIVTDIYAAGEDPLPGVTCEALADAVRAGSGVPVDVVHRLDDVPAVAVGMVRPGDVILTLGAGSVGTLPERLLQVLEAGA